MYPQDRVDGRIELFLSKLVMMFMRERWQDQNQQKSWNLQGYS